MQQDAHPRSGGPAIAGRVSFNASPGNVTLVEFGAHYYIVSRYVAPSCLAPSRGISGDANLSGKPVFVPYGRRDQTAARAANARPFRDNNGMTAKRNDKPAITLPDNAWQPATSPHLSVVPKAAGELRKVSADQAGLPGELSVRAENVLKMLALELTGDDPPRGRWTPPDLLLERLTYRHLSTARNCGPQTTAEIVHWAAMRGKVLPRPMRAGHSLSAMWQDTISRFSTGEFSKTEVAEALENSTRRRNTRIPVALQKIILQLIRSPNE